MKQLQKESGSRYTNSNRRNSKETSSQKSLIV